jgi:hypothetical protein
MSSVSLNRKTAKLKQLLGVRARLALLALILVAPLMFERARSLEDARFKQLVLASAEFAGLAKQSAEAQREVISSVETVPPISVSRPAASAAAATSCAPACRPICPGYAIC